MRVLNMLALSGLHMFTNRLVLSWAMHPDVCEGLFPFCSLPGLQLGHPSMSSISSLDIFKECCQCTLSGFYLFLIIYALLYYPYTSFFNKSTRASGNRWYHWGARVNLAMFCSPFAPCTFQLPQFLINNVQRYIPDGTFQSGAAQWICRTVSDVSWIT